MPELGTEPPNDSGLRQYAKCDWCGQMTRVVDRADADRWLRAHDCPEADPNEWSNRVGGVKWNR